MKHLIDFEEYTTEEILKILDLADDIKANPEKYQQSLVGKKLYMLFEKTSTRTYLSFATGMEEMGGKFYCQNWEDSNFAIGDLISELKYVGRNVDVIMMRLKKNEMVKDFQKNSLVPFINGCDNTFHPCQALADLMTMREKVGTTKANLMYIGAENNVFYSLVQLMNKVGGTVYGVTPLQNETNIPDGFMDEMKKSGCYVQVECDNWKAMVSEMDVVYTDTWVDMEYFQQEEWSTYKNNIISKMLPFQLSSQLLEHYQGLVFHDMPIHIGYEISQEVVDKHMETILDQAENRRHVEKAILHYLLKG